MNTRFSSRRARFVRRLALLVAASASILTTSPAQVKISAPERGFVSMQPATTWEEGLISGNGTIGANVFGRPVNETIIFTQFSREDLAEMTGTNFYNVSRILSKWEQNDIVGLGRKRVVIKNAHALVVIAEGITDR